jgi:hypothetical protein
MKNSSRAPRVLVISPVALGCRLASQGCRSGGRGPMERSGRAVDRSAEKVGNVFRR